MDLHAGGAMSVVSIAASLDGKEPYQEIVPFADVNAPSVLLYATCVTDASATYEQLINFPQPVRLLGVRILMKQARNEYFGINLVQLIGGGNPTIRIQSGITSPHQDMCLQMDEHEDVVLDGCITSLTAMDGRALWKFNELGQLYNPITNKCMVLKDNIDLDGGQIIGQDCAEAYKHNDGRSVWELQPNNQLKLLKGGSFCLSQEGTKAGSSDVAKNKQVKTSHPRAGDTAHSPAAAVDGDSGTYWASQSFSANAAPDAVFLEVDLGEKYKLNHLAIAWEYPAMSFTISLSADGNNFDLIAKEATNSLYTSLVDTKGSIGRYLRVALLKPHPTHGKVEQEYLYGIRTLSAYSNRLRSIVQHCGTAKNSKDARDKYFLELVAEVDFVSGNELAGVAERMNNATNQLGIYLNEVEGIMAQLKTCKADKEQAKGKLRALNTEYENLSNQLADLENDGILEPLDSIRVCGGYGLEPVHLHSASQITPLHRMLRWMELDLQRPVPLGVNDGRGYFYSLDLKKDITEYVMSPEAQQMGLPNAVGIGIEGLVFFDSSVVEMSAIICSTNKDALNPPPSYVDISCSTTLGGNAIFNGPPGTTVSVKCPGNCLTVAAEGAQVVGGPEGGYTEDSAVCLAAIHSSVLGSDSLVTVRVVDAPEEFDGSDSNGIMSDSYAGPRAARAFLVEPLVVECPHPEAGELKRGVTRQSLQTTTRDGLSSSQMKAAYNIHVGIEGAARQSGSAVSLPPQQQQQYQKQQPEKVHTAAGITPVSEVAAGRPETAETTITDSKSVNAATEAAIELLQEMLNMRVGHITPEVVDSIGREANRTRTAQLSERTQGLVTALSSTGGRVAATLSRAEEELKKTTSRAAAQTAADSWVLTAFTEADFFDVFEVFNSKTAVGVGAWRMGNAPVGGRDGLNTLSQTAAVGASMLGSVAVGTYVRLKNKKFYDGILTADVYISGTGSVGIAFRMKDFANMFLFELKQETGKFKRLLRIVDGTPMEVARLEDGGYIEGKWYTVRIEMRQSRIRISVSEKPTQTSLLHSDAAAEAASTTVSSLVAAAPEPDIDVLDGRFPSGSIGFFTSGVDAAYFDAVRFEALPCVLQDVPPPPEPLTCSTYRELGFHNSWHVVDPASAVGRSQWEVRTNIGGEHKVVAQMTPSMAILGGNRGCESGTFSFRVMPQCSSGLVGGVFKYKDQQNYMLLELGPSFARLRKKANGVFSTSAKSFLAGFKPGQWNTVSITFSGGNVVINAGKVFSPIPVFSVFGGTAWHGGSVGLASWSCGGVAFADILLHPLKEKPPPFAAAKESDASQEVEAGKTGHLGELAFVEKDEDLVGIQACTGRIHWEDRKAFCEKNRVEAGAVATTDAGEWGELDAGATTEPRERCTHNFCDVCCEREFPLSAKARDTCRQHCHQNDKESILALDAVQHATEDCTIDERKPLYKICSTENDMNKCYEDVCEMCCETNRLSEQFSIPSRTRGYILGECKKACNNEISLKPAIEVV